MNFQTHIYGLLYCNTIFNWIYTSNRRYQYQLRGYWQINSMNTWDHFGGGFPCLILSDFNIKPCLLLFRNGWMKDLNGNPKITMGCILYEYPVRGSGYQTLSYITGKNWCNTRQLIGIHMLLVTMWTCSF